MFLIPDLWPSESLSILVYPSDSAGRYSRATRVGPSGLINVCLTDWNCADWIDKECRRLALPVYWRLWSAVASKTGDLFSSWSNDVTP